MEKTQINYDVHPESVFVFRPGGGKIENSTACILVYKPTLGSHGSSAHKVLVNFLGKLEKGGQPHGIQTSVFLNNGLNAIVLEASGTESILELATTLAENGLALAKGAPCVSIEKDIALFCRDMRVEAAPVPKVIYINIAEATRHISHFLPPADEIYTIIVRLPGVNYPLIVR